MVLKMTTVTRVLAAVTMVCAASFAVGAAPAGASPSAPSADNAFLSSCLEYTPSDLTINVTSAAPGQTVQISGLGYPGDTVTIRISVFGGLPIDIGSAVVSPSGLFLTDITIPATLSPGTYTITASSPNCPLAATISLIITGSTAACFDTERIRAQRGDTVDWDLLGNLDTTKDLTVTLVPNRPGPAVIVYSGPYPASGSIEFVVPASMRNGRWAVVEQGDAPSGGPAALACGTLIIRGGGSNTTTTTAPTTTEATTTTADVLGSSTTSVETTTTTVAVTTTTADVTTTTADVTTTTADINGSTTTTADVSTTSSDIIGSSTTAVTPTTTTPGTVVCTIGNNNGNNNGNGNGNGNGNNNGTGNGINGDGNCNIGDCNGVNNCNVVNNNGSDTDPVGALANEAIRPTEVINSEVLGTTNSRGSDSGVMASGLAVTGSTVRPYITLGVTLAAAGALLLIGRRRRN